MEKGIFEENDNYESYYLKQLALRDKIVHEDDFNTEIKYIAGVDVAYNEEKQKMVGAIVVLAANTLEVIEEAFHIMDITFPYVPGLFSFREIPALLGAYDLLKQKPDLIICDGQGIAHPKGIGMASHLGIELDVPTIGCAKKRLVGDFEEVGQERGSYAALVFEKKEVGRVLRTRTDVKPVFVSIGHRISIKTACDWVLKMAPDYRLPETTRKADTIVNDILKTLD